MAKADQLAWPTLADVTDAAKAFLDPILAGLIEQHKSVETLCEEFPEETVRWVASKLDRNEFKRRQMPPGIKLSQRAFGTGRRMPMAARFDG